MAFGLLSLPPAPPSSASYPITPTALPNYKIPEVIGGRATGSLDYESPLPLLALPISANGTSLSLTALA